MSTSQESTPNIDLSTKKEGFSMDRILDHIEENLKKKRISSPKKPLILRQKSKPTILILTTKSFGKGHQSASRSLVSAFETFHKDRCDIQVLDLFRECNGFIDQALKACYDNSIKYLPNVWKWFFDGTSGTGQTRLMNMLSYPFIIDKLAPIIADIHPDLIISTYPPLWNLALERVLDELKLKPKTMSVITDSMSVHQGWISDSTDYYMVANEETKQSCMDLGVNEDRICTFGFPVGLDFEEGHNNLRAEYGHNAPLSALMILCTGVTAKDVQLVYDLKETFGDQLGLTVITGKNKEMYDSLHKAQLPEPVRIVGWTDEMAKYMQASDLVITKAGGATVMECIATKTPMLITKVIPGQEEGNAGTIEAHKLGTIAESPEEIVQTIGAYIRNPHLLQSIKENFSTIHKPNAAKHISDFAVAYVHKS